MHTLIRHTAVLIAVIAGLAKSHAQIDLDLAAREALSKVVGQRSLDEITEDGAVVVLRFSRALPSGRIASDLSIRCERGRPWLIIQDLTEKYEDRWGSMDPGLCDALLTAARQQKGAQRR